MVAILKILKYLRSVNFDIGYEKIITNFPRKVFLMLMTSLVMTSQRDVKVDLHSCLNKSGTSSAKQVEVFNNRCQTWTTYVVRYYREACSFSR